jgi:hypothetical protein
MHRFRVLVSVVDSIATTKTKASCFAYSGRSIAAGNKGVEVELPEGFVILSYWPAGEGDSIATFPRVVAEWSEQARSRTPLAHAITCDPQ